MRTMTQRGFQWVLVALTLALAADVILLASILLQAYGDLSPSASAVPSLLWGALLFACAIPAYLGFQRLREGRGESGAERAPSGRRGTVFFLLGALSAVLYTVTGLILGYVYVPNGAYTGGPPSPIPVLLGEAIRGVHGLAPAVLAVFVGLFLLSPVWERAPTTQKVLASVALVAGFLGPVTWFTSFYLGIPMLTAAVALALVVVPVVSLSLWIGVYVLALRRLRRSAPARASAATVA